MSLRWNIAQAVERKWWQNYLRKKPVGEYLEWKRNYWQELLAPINQLIEFEKPQEILDAGCGPAGTFLVLEQHNVTAVDPLINQYKNDLHHFDPKRNPWVNFINKPLEEYSAQTQFDGVFCMNAINHVVDIDKAWDMLFATIKPGGWIVTTIDAHNHAGLKHLFRAIPGDVLHPHQYDLKEYESMLSERGCEITYRKNLKSEFFFDHWILAGRISSSNQK